MPKTKISEYSATNSANTDIEGINIDEGCPPSSINNAIREVMVHLKEFQTGASGDAFTFAGGTLMSGTNTISGAAVISGNINSSGTTNTFSGGNILSGTNTFSGTNIFSSDVTLNAQSDLRFADSDSSNWVAFQSPATVASNVTWTLPDTDGTSNQALVTNGSGTLSWATAGGGGKVLQVVQATRTTGTSTTSTSYVTSNLSVSITPASASNKVLVLFNAHCSKNGDSGIWLSLRRGATQISEFIGNAFFEFNGNMGGSSCSTAYLDAPSTTSSTTYEIFVKSQAGTSTASMFINSAMGTLIVMEIAA
jgi:hypothetical protein